jgi:hypothetical protein
LGRTCTLGVVGNPNCGKTTLFNAPADARQRIGNCPGVTVERKVGGYRFEGIDSQVVDLSGTDSLDVTGEGAALDERIARDFVPAGEADSAVAGISPREPEVFSVLAGMSAAVATIPVNLAEALRPWWGPLGTALGDARNIAGAAADGFPEDPCTGPGRGSAAGPGSAARGRLRS